LFGTALGIGSGLKRLTRISAGEPTPLWRLGAEPSAGRKQGRHTEWALDHGQRGFQDDFRLLQTWNFRSESGPCSAIERRAAARGNRWSSPVPRAIMRDHSQGEMIRISLLDVAGVAFLLWGCSSNTASCLPAPPVENIMVVARHPNLAKIDSTSFARAQVA
jgi:hypothetical protein